jgi:hypothetical protein
MPLAFMKRNGARFLPHEETIVGDDEESTGILSERTDKTENGIGIEMCSDFV